MRKQFWVLLGGTFALLTITIACLMYVQRAKAQTTGAPANSVTLPARFSYAAKFVCGLESENTSRTPPQEPPVKPGNYATVINLHNPWATTVNIVKKVALAAPETFPNTVLINPTPRFPDTLTSDHAMSIDCTEIVNLLTRGGIAVPGPFIDGWVVIDSWFPTAPTPTAAQLDVFEVTSTASGFGATVNSHDVTVVPGRSLPAGTWPF